MHSQGKPMGSSISEEHSINIGECLPTIPQNNEIIEDHSRLSGNEDEADESEEEFEKVFESEWEISENEEDVPLSTNAKLCEWAVDHKVTLKALSDLLSILKYDDIIKNDLPKDPRTLLRISSTKVDVVEVSGGIYWHFGLEKILNVLNNSNCSIPDTIIATFNVDGVPVTNSSNDQFYPILMAWKGVKFSPMVIGIFYGKNKPNSLEYLQSFVDEISAAVVNGVTIHEQKRSFSAHKFCVDTPALAHLLNIKGHTGYYSCNACKVEGIPSKHSNKVICFTDLENERRTDAEFRAYYTEGSNEKQFVEHFHGNIITPLSKIPHLDLVEMFPRDPMHLCFLGISKKLIGYWTTKPALNKAGKLPIRKITAIDEEVEKIKNMFPSDFNRKCRPFTVFKYWKATEHRSFVFFFGSCCFEG